MTIQITLPAKRRIDVRPFKVDFSQWLDSGESVTAAQLSVSLFTGTDPDPAAILYLDPEILNNVVTQRIREGIPGNIYTITMEVTTNLGNELTAETVQAVLPDGVPAEDIYIPLFLTSRPYPLNDIVAFQSSGTPVTGFIILIDLDAFDHSVSITAATLRNILRTYSNWPAEAVDHVSSLLSGNLRNILITYSAAKPEAIDHGCSFTGGLLRNALIIYTNWPDEAVDHSCSLLSGSLT